MAESISFTFTPAMSLFVDRVSRDELDALHSKLVEGGSSSCDWLSILAAWIGWVHDRFGVSWQTNFVVS